MPTMNVKRRTTTAYKVGMSLFWTILGMEVLYIVIYEIVH